MNGYQNRSQIWAEENGGLSAGQYEWSFGNGDIGNMGIVVPQHFRIYALTFEATANVANETRVRVVIDGVPQSLVEVVVAASERSATAVVPRAERVLYMPGTRIGFYTQQGSGSGSGNRVCAWLETP